MKNMKRKSLIVAMLPVLFGLFVMQSCTTKDLTIKTFQSFTNPVATAPLNASTVKITGTTVDLTWASTDGDGDAPLADVYFGLDSKPALYKAANSGLKITVPVAIGKTYYWKVTMKDANGVMTYGPTWNFTIFDPIGVFVASYTCDEPAEGWTYPVVFTKLSDTTLKIDQYWASWPAVFTVDLTALTYSMALTDFGGGYSAIESGTINTTTGQIKGNYTIYNKGKVEEVGVHTYTKK
jgi:hypothetical protein